MINGNTMGIIMLKIYYNYWFINSIISTFNFDSQFMHQCFFYTLIQQLCFHVSSYINCVCMLVSYCFPIFWYHGADFIPYNPQGSGRVLIWTSGLAGHTGWQYRYLLGPCGRLGSCCCSCCCCMRCCRPRALLMHFCSLASAAIVLLWVLALPSCMENLSLAIMQKNNKKGKGKKSRRKENAEKKELSYEGPACGPFLCYRNDKVVKFKERGQGDGGTYSTFHHRVRSRLCSIGKALQVSSINVMTQLTACNTFIQ